MHGKEMGRSPLKVKGGGGGGGNGLRGGGGEVDVEERWRRSR